MICIGLAIATYWLKVEPLYYWFGISALVLLIFLIVTEIIISKMKKEAEKNPDVQSGNYVYWDYEAEPGCWAHNDSLSCLMIYRTDKVKLSEEQNTNDGWTVVSKLDSGRRGACGEIEDTTEIRKNGVTIKYSFCWKKQYSWLLQYDIVRMLYDINYYNETLAKAENGDADAQTLIGCCYGHNGKMSDSYVKHNVRTAVQWWNKAADQGHRYAMRELALFYFHRENHEKARELNKKGNLNIFIISYGSEDYFKRSEEYESNSQS